MYPDCTPVNLLLQVAEKDGDPSTSGVDSVIANALLKIIADTIEYKRISEVDIIYLAMLFAEIANEHGAFRVHVLEGANACPMECDMCRQVSREAGWLGTSD